MPEIDAEETLDRNAAQPCLRRSSHQARRVSIATARQSDNQIDIVDGNGAINVMWVVGVWQGPVGLTAGGAALPGSRLGTAAQTGDRGWRFEVPDGTVVELLLRQRLLFGVTRGNRGGPRTG